DSRFQTTHVIEKLHGFGMKIARRQIRQRKFGLREHALKSKIVNRQTGARRTPPPFMQLLVQNEEWNQSNLPIVNVNELRFPRQIARQIYDGFGEENKALRVVGITQRFLLIQTGAIKKSGLLNKVDREIFSGFMRPDFALNVS